MSQSIRLLIFHRADVAKRQPSRRFPSGGLTPRQNRYQYAIRIGFRQESAVNCIQTAEHPTERAGCPWHAGAALLALLVLSIPIVVCMPLTSDTVLFDLQAKIVLNGGALYRDVIEPNLPGVVWIHILVRTLVGWTSEAIRLIDLALFGFSAGLLSAIAVAARNSRRDVSPNSEASGNISSETTSVFLRIRDALSEISVPLLFLCLFYLSRNEWCHCQRDTWMLLPAVLAMLCRDASLSRREHRMFSKFAMLEGVFWGVAFWIKPHVAVSVVLLCLAEIVTSAQRRLTLSRIAVVGFGGLFCAVPGIIWLVNTGAWSSFVDMQLNWNPEYLASGRSRKTMERVGMMMVRFHPWWLVHLIALPVSVKLMRDYFRMAGRDSEATEFVGIRRQASLSMLYLSWFLQACLLQHAMDYIQVPPVMLGIAVITSVPVRRPSVVRRTLLTAAATLGFLMSPQLWPERLSLWFVCVQEGSSTAVRAELAQGRFPDWKNLQQVVEFLQRQNVRSGDVTCVNVHSLHIYDALRILPSTRYPAVAVLMELFPSRRDQIETAVRTSGHRFVVTDADERRLDVAQYPGCLPVIFQAGQFRVHTASGETEARHSAAQPEAHVR
jgi:hypothetical protein